MVAPPLEELITDAAIAQNDAQRAAFWRLREEHSAALKPEGGGWKHDVSVPLSRLPEFLARATQACEAAMPGLRVCAFGHFGDGNVHFHVRAPAGRDPARWYAEDVPLVSAFVHDLVVAAGGTISAEHGLGQMKRDEFARLTPPGELAALHAVKQALDPAGLMNPGKLLALAPNTPSN